MKIGLIDVDGHNYPNLALMKISAWHKARGDTVEWWWSDLFHYDVVYVLTNFNSTPEEDLARVYALRDLGYSPYVMIYNKDQAPQETRHLQRWCNNRLIFKAQPDFRKYDPKRG